MHAHACMHTANACSTSGLVRVAAVTIRSFRWHHRPVGSDMARSKRCVYISPPPSKPKLNNGPLAVLLMAMGYNHTSPLDKEQATACTHLIPPCPALPKEALGAPLVCLCLICSLHPCNRNRAMQLECPRKVAGHFCCQKETEELLHVTGARGAAMT